jgi:FixJ family two-component response regulator
MPDRSSSSPRLRILVADDDAACRDTIGVLLRGAGFDVLHASDARTAIATLASESVSLVLSDINMPGNERLDLVHDIAGRHPGLPVILVTGFPTTETAIESFNAGVVSYLQKPVRAPQLLDAVQRAIGLYETGRVVARSLEHLRSWTEDLTKLEQQMRNTRAATQQQVVGTFLDVSLRRVMASITDIREVVEVLSLSPGGAAGMRTHDLERAVRDTIGVLERTKRDFKSKELAELRQRLETLIDCQRAPGEKSRHS